MAEEDDVDGLAALAALTSSAGTLPVRITRCPYDPEERAWVRLLSHFEEDPGRLLHGFTHQVEKARSGLATCKRCGEKIAKASFRIGFPTKDPRGEYGAIPVWLHLDCSRRADKAVVSMANAGNVVLNKKMIGYMALTDEEQSELCTALLRPIGGADDEEDIRKMAPPVEVAKRQLPRAPAPAQLRVELLPFQAEGLHWLLEREADPETRGGVLADEMGMGKTLEAISLILASGASGPTLVVCPAAAMLQWRNEIVRFTEPSALEVEIYYGFDRKSLNFEGKLNTIVLTTYQTMEADFRVEINKQKVLCCWCQRLFLPDKLKFHQKYFCGPDAQKTEKQDKQDRKTDAVKRMKIGGQETDIVLNPLNAIRGAGTAGCRRLVRKTSPLNAADVMDQQATASSGGAASSSDSVPTFVPFPVGVLPEEARERLGYGAASPSAAGRGRGRGRGRGQKRKVPDTPDDHRGQPSEQEPSKLTPAKTAVRHKLSGNAWRRNLSGPTPSPSKPSCSPASSPAASSLPASSPAASSPPASSPAASLSGWSVSIKNTPKVLDLDSDSGIEMMEPSPPVPEQSPSASPPVVAKDADGSLPSKDADGSPPPRPTMEEEDDRGNLDLSRSALFRTRWGRVILDEAHRIKGRTNSTAQAAFALHARTRWCLSGTPLQNRVGEMYSLVRFLRFYPYAHYICSKKGCKCVSLHYKFDAETSKCESCGHTKMQHRSHFMATVSGPIQKFGFIGAGKVAMEKLRGDVIDRILLRRTKLERQADINLPPMTIKIRRDPLSAEEKDFYQSMYMSSLTKFDTYVDKGTLLHNYAHVFDLIMRLRQAVDHPYLIVHGSLKTVDGSAIPTASRGDVDVCALCQDDVDDPAVRVVAQCGHSFHRECVSEYLEQAPELPTGGIGCPTCFAPLTVNLEEGEGEEGEDMEVPLPVVKRKPSIMQRIKSAKFKSSTKIEALMQEVNRMIAASSGSKALVFSQFVNFLELIEHRLKQEGISCAKVTGSMPIQSRSNVIISFQTDPSLKVLLISLKAGGEGLNLQAADHIFIMDPWWNPAAELQAMQRAHRIGQTRPVHAIRMVASDTIEDKILELQAKKQSVFDCTVGNSNSALSRLTAEDIQFLFQQ